MARPIFIIFLVVLFYASPAAADTGLPMLMIVWPGMIAALIPVIALESYCLRSMLKLPFVRSLKLMTIANLESTIIGIPLTWAVLLLIEIILTFAGSSIFKSTELPEALSYTLMITLGAPWLAPFSQNQAYWIIPAASFFLLIPFYFITWYIEYRCLKKRIKKTKPATLSRVVRNINLISYGLLGIIVLGWLVASIFGVI
jgi:hypothetical protein